MKRLLENWQKHLNEQRDQRPRKEPTHLKAKLKKDTKRKEDKTISIQLYQGIKI